MCDFSVYAINSVSCVSRVIYIISLVFTSEKWLRKRQLALIVFTFQNMVIGIDDALIMTTLWIYLKEMVKTEHPSFFYTIILVSFSFSSLVTSSIIERIADKTRKTRMIFFVCNIIAIAGNILYTIHFSAWYLLAGRILCGFACPMRSVIVGELSRCYESDELASKITLVSAMFTLGYIIAPVFNLIFLMVDVRLGNWHLGYENIARMVLARGEYYVNLPSSETFLVLIFRAEKKYLKPIDVQTRVA